MANDGILVVIINVDMKKRELLVKPNITTRGFVQVNENEELIRKIEYLSEKIIKEQLADPHSTFATIKIELTSKLNSYIGELTGRRPIVLPVILDIKKEATTEVK